MLAMLLFATIALQLDVGEAGCVDCIGADIAGLDTNASDSSSTPDARATTLSSQSGSKDSDKFPLWVKTALGIAVVALGLVLAGRKVISNLFIFKTKNRNYGGAKASHSKNHHRDDWKAKGAYRIHSKQIY